MTSVFTPTAMSRISLAEADSHTAVKKRLLLMGVYFAIP
jgi:hypothetical protein